MSNDLILETKAATKRTGTLQHPDVKSPLAHFGRPDTGQLFAGEGLTITERVALDLVVVRGEVGDPDFAKAILAQTGAAIPRVPNTISRSSTHIVAWLGPDEWLISSHTENTDPAGVSHVHALLSAGFKGIFAAAVDVGSGYTTLRLEGPLWSETLSRGCPLDFDMRTHDGNACAQSHFFKSPVLLLWIAEDILDIVVRRSFAEYAVLMLRDAAQSACDIAARR